ncbi:predicted protein [Sclerotinia sclerotiorum 1980 UF-70]|uniref:ABM domain-containing protein n=2 Tax=Sclerotinia sclerotiorum (strain ATCC 18683 / 1980 / Ss-1) TaxID=665079 RepID=A7EL66_SCLS1|nr:predicted protein [Sclerotinia sclerotiorum 1980 UF-70]APA09740.1 hypothetical protein sscle_05g045100 [Sclerotinia sclerotiorum 1980 UF-70]EDO03582.1 predicted protein [Sclerotinia sclerotiorum 1980 UF-70]
MPCTELALLPLTSPLSPRLIPKLRIAKHVLETAAGYPCYFYQQVENPSYIYIVGTWESPQHHERFIPSVENLGLFDLLKGEVVVGVGVGETVEGRGIRMWHLDCDALQPLRVGTEKGPGEEDSKKKSPFSAPIISCNRYFITSSNKEGFREKYGAVKHVLAEEAKEYEIEGGWRIEKEAEDKDEWVMFCGWKSVEKHLAFSTKEGFREWRGIVDWVDGFEVRHLRKIEGL